VWPRYPVIRERTIASLAEQLSRASHGGQYRKDGTPYIAHVERVVARVADEEIAMQLAWLHDVIEDTVTTYEQLIKKGIAPEVVEAVVLVTKGAEIRGHRPVSQSINIRVPGSRSGLRKVTSGDNEN